jgi:hypothetical protein
LVIVLFGGAVTLTYGLLGAGLREGPPLVLLTLGGFVLGFSALALYRVIDPLIHGGSARAEAGIAPVRIRELEREKQLVLRAIREVEHDFQMRKVGEELYKDTLQRYRARAMRLMREIDAATTSGPHRQELKARLAALGRRDRQRAVGAGVPGVRRGRSDAVYCKVRQGAGRRRRQGGDMVERSSPTSACWPCWPRPLLSPRCRPAGHVGKPLRHGHAGRDGHHSPRPQGAGQPVAGAEVTAIVAASGATPASTPPPAAPTTRHLRGPHRRLHVQATVTVDGERLEPRASPSPPAAASEVMLIAGLGAAGGKARAASRRRGGGKHNFSMGRSRGGWRRRRICPRALELDLTGAAGKPSPTPRCASAGPPQPGRAGAGWAAHRRLRRAGRALPRSAHRRERRLRGGHRPRGHAPVREPFRMPPRRHARAIWPSAAARIRRP